MADTVLVTGSSTGLGREMALHLAGSGFRVYASMRSLAGREELEAEAQRRNVQLTVLALDVTDQSSVDAAIATIVRESGGIYGVVNNAGIGLRGYFEDLTDAEERAVYDANLFGGMAVTRAALPHMRAAGRGRILMISSIAGKVASPGLTAYCASKFAVEGFGEALALELRPFGIYVSIIEPGIIKTERWGVNRGTATRANDRQSPYFDLFQEHERLADRLVQRSTATPADVARVVEAALTAESPRLRYMIGRKAKMVVIARKYLPGELFERLYFGVVLRRVTRSKRGWNGWPRLTSTPRDT